MPGLRHPLSALLAGAALCAGLTACASTVDGTPTFSGQGGPETTTSTTEAPPSTTEPTTTSATPTETGPSGAEETACFLIPLSDLDAFTAFNDLADKPEAEQTQDMRNNVANLFDAAQMEVQGYVDPLPEGPIRDAAVAYQNAQIEVRDRLRAGDAVNTQIILDAEDVLDSACGTS